MDRKKLGVLLLAGSCLLMGCSRQTNRLAEGNEAVNEWSEREGTEVETTEAIVNYSKDIFAMDTYMTLTAYGEEAKAAVEAAEAEINRIEQLVSTGIDTSEIAKLNQEGVADVSKDTAYLIQRSLELNDSTEGAFDITIYPLMVEWGFTDQNYQVPKQERIQELLEQVDSSAVERDEDRVSLHKEEMEIDLGGIAKGYTSARIMEIFKEYGIKSGVVSLGGNVQVLGTKTDGSDWRVAVENPGEEGTYIGVLEVSDKAVITSGGYERYFEQDGKTYHHILDPKTGYPAESGLTSVTIVSEDGTLADGLSTSLFIMGKEKAIEYWRENSKEFDAILVESDGTISVTETIAANFTSDYDFQVIDQKE